ncbi:PGPGW domain-containing protein [Nocardioides sp.]|uniref:PGPGW domain-containing protein n=1 Tax=Nocardioides sp. TaxID=35761 RepID=UPI002C2BF3A4|nr:PGPGW domain-containing protein [Nocardioides sp.]HSX67096.1 PGPGW domain-containing protein [Nocardioides sp.]
MTDTRPHPLKRLHERLHANPVTGLVTKIVVSVIGLAVLAAGVVMMVTPGPGLVGIAAGLAILATEWDWADRWVKAARQKAREAADKARAMDPAVRRRRTLLTAAAVLLAAGVVALLIWQFGWPSLAVTGWDKVQSISDVVPELPGM